MNRIFLLIGIVFGSIHMQAQQGWCGSDAYLEQYLNEHPEHRSSYETQRHEFSQLTQSFIARTGEKKIIPVVVHVIWQECEDNISLGQIKDAIRIINEDFSRTNADTASTRDVFKTVAADSEIEFRLARFDPAGNPTDGVVRIQSAATTNAQNNVKNLSYWPSNRYLNIWVVSSISNFTGGAGIILGYAQFPGTGSWNTYGIVIRNDAMGTIGTSNADGRTLSHEIGHCLNLYHTFQDGCGGNCAFTGDDVCDTPPSAESTQSCTFSYNTCSNDASGSSAFNSDVPDMIENYMSYNDCQNMFSEGQKTRMQAALSNFSQLSNLVSLENLTATGVQGLALVDFEISTDLICQNQPVKFKDNSLYGATNFNWDFGVTAEPNSSTNTSPVVKFSESGIQNLTYTVGDGATQKTRIKPVFVASSEGQYLPYSEDMESVGGLPVDQWLAINSDLDEYEWKATNETAFSGTRSLKMDAYGSCGFRSDLLISQSFDFSNLNKVTISFKTAFAQRQASDNDFLRMYVSADCGETWELNWVKGGSALASSAPNQNVFVPTQADQWQTNTITLTSSSYMNVGVILKFEFVARGGNNLYFDDFELVGEFSGELLLRYPENGKKGLTPNVLIDWKSAGVVDSYEFEVDQTIDFNTTSKISGSRTYIDEGRDNADTEFLLQNLNLGETYYWRVRSIKSGVASDWSAIWSFEISESGIGVEELGSSTIQIYPNPAHDKVTIASNALLNSVSLIDINGRLILSNNQIVGKQYEMPTESISPGIYMVKVLDKNGKLTVNRLVIQ